MIKLVIFDFDGVICESIDVKTDAFCQLFAHVPDHVEEIKQYHLDNGGISRVVKFQHIYKYILKENLTQEKLEELCDQFSRLVKQKVIESPFVKGAREFLENHLDKYPMYVASGTPENEMRDIVAERNLQKYFKEVFGSPKRKSEIIKNILSADNIEAEETVFVGDSINDFEAAQETGVHFIARYTDDNKDWVAHPNIELKCKDLTSLPAHMDLINNGTKI